MSWVPDGFQPPGWQPEGWQPESAEAPVKSAALTGTALAGATEQQIVDGGLTIIITLTNDTWVAAGTTFDAQRQNIIDGLTSAQSEATGWNAEVRDNLAVTTVVRTSATVVTITLSASASYDITTNETITATIPATALVGAEAIVATPVIGVSAFSTYTMYTRTGRFVHPYSKFFLR